MHSSPWHNTATVADNPIVADRQAQSGQLTAACRPARSTSPTSTSPTSSARPSRSRTSPCSHARRRRRDPVAASARSQAGSDGSWNITSDVALADGHYAITATAVDQFGETTDRPAPVVITSNLLIDTVGPRDRRHVLQPAEWPG